MTTLTFLQTQASRVSCITPTNSSGVWSVAGEVIQPEQEKECLDTAEMTIHQLLADSYAFSDTELQRPSRCRPSAHGGSSSSSSKSNDNDTRNPIGRGSSIHYGQARHVSNPESNVGLSRRNVGEGPKEIKAAEYVLLGEKPSIPIIVEPPQQKQTGSGPDYYAMGDQPYLSQLHRKSLWELAPTKGRLRDALNTVDTWTKQDGRSQPIQMPSSTRKNRGLLAASNHPPAESYLRNTLYCEQQNKLSSTHRHSRSFPRNIQQGMYSKLRKPLHPRPQVYPELHLFPPMPATVAAPICSVVNVGSTTTSKQNTNFRQEITPLQTEIGNLDEISFVRREVRHKVDQLDRIAADYANLKVLLDEQTYKHLQNLDRGLLQSPRTFRGLHFAITHLEGETYVQQTSLDNLLMQACTLKSHYEQFSTAILTRHRQYFLRALLEEDGDEDEDEGESGYDDDDDVAEGQGEGCREGYGLKIKRELQKCKYCIELLQREIACLAELKQKFRTVREGVGSIASVCQITQLQCRKQFHARQHQHQYRLPPPLPSSPPPLQPSHHPHLRASSQNWTSPAKRGRLLSRLGSALGLGSESESR